MLDAFSGADSQKRIRFFCFAYLTAAVGILPGCSKLPTPVSVPASVSAAEACGISSSVWRQIPIPAQRDVLLDLRSGQNEYPTRKYFLIPSVTQELWFEDADHNFTGCRIRQQVSCGGGIFSTVMFSRQGELWKPEPVFTTICSD